MRLGEAATAVRRRADGLWQTDTAATRYLSRHVVLATGANARPHLPELPGRDSFRGRLLHSSELRRSADFRGQRVLVVGLGNSGADLVVDLVTALAQLVVAAVALTITLLAALLNAVKRMLKQQNNAMLP